MKHLLLALFILNGLYATAQAPDLFVRPNPTTLTDSYIFVNDVELFVTDDIELEINTNAPATTEASIYLRNNAQLFQGSDIAKNKGDGFLSVYQDSHSDSYDYNYWSSPVGNNRVAGPDGNLNSGAFVLNQANSYAANETAATQTLIDPSFFGRGSGDGSLQPLVISNRWVYKYENDSQGYVRLYGANAIRPGYGFTMKGTNITPEGGDQFEDANNQNYDFRGRPNNGTIEITTSTIMDNIQSGNPYPSALDLGLVAQSNPDLINSFQFWDEDRSINSHNYRDNQGGYEVLKFMGNDPNMPMYTRATFYSYTNGGQQTGGGNGFGEINPRRYAPIAQGFNIVTGPTTGTIRFQNSQRVYVKESPGVSVFHKPIKVSDLISLTAYINTDGGDDDENDDEGNGNDDNGNDDEGSGNDDDGNDDNGDGENENTTELPYIRFETFFGTSHSRDMVVAFSDTADVNFDNGYDAFHPNDGGGTDIVMPIKDAEGVERNFVIQGLPFSDKVFIPLTIKIAGQNTLVKMKGVAQNNLPGNIYFYDEQTAAGQLLNDGRVAEINLAPNVYKDRFFLVAFLGEQRTFNEALNEEFLAVTEEAKRSVSFYQNNRASQLEVKNPDSYDIKLANIFDISGRLVVSKANIGEQRNFELPTINLSDGVYIVKLTTAENINIDYKITVQN